MILDIHTRLDNVRYDEDRQAIIASAREAEIEAFITIGCKAASLTAIAVDLSCNLRYILRIQTGSASVT